MINEISRDDNHENGRHPLDPQCLIEVQQLAECGVVVMDRATSPLERILARLEYRKSGDGFIAKCPAHEDSTPSLSIKEAEDGKVLLHCLAGCKLDAILNALRLSRSDLFPRNGKSRHTTKKRDAFTSRKSFESSNPPGLTLEEFARSKQFSLDFLRTHGVSEGSNKGSRRVRFEYRDANGSLAAVRFRVSLTGDRFQWRSGDKVQLYGLLKLSDAKKRGYITLMEGETDSLTLWLHDEPALGYPGAATWNEAWADYLTGIPLIYVVIEPDKGGETVKKWLSKSSIRHRVKLFSLDKHKDPSDLYLAEGAAFLEKWSAAKEGAIPFVDIEKDERNQAGEAAYALAKELLLDKNLLEKIGGVMQKRGYAGDLNPPKLG